MSTNNAKINLWVECGDNYYYGRNGEKVDYEMAAHFYEKAAEKGHTRAVDMLEEAKKHLAGVEGSTTEVPEYDLLFADSDLEYTVNVEQIIRKLSLPVKESGKGLTYEEIEAPLRNKFKYGSFYDDDHSALTLTLLMIKAKRGSAALFNREIVRAYISDLLPRVRDARLLSALVFDTEAINYMRDDPQKALELLIAQGISAAEAGQLTRCFANASAIPVVCNENDTK